MTVGLLSFAGGGTLGLVANRTDVPQTFQSIAANFTSRREHFSHPDGGFQTIQSIDVGFDAFSNADSRTIKRFIEYPQNTFTQMTWSGATSVTIAPGAVVKSDVISLTVPPATKLWERTVNLNATVTNFPVIQTPSSSPSLGLDDGNSVTDQGNSGTIAASDSFGFGAAALIGQIGTRNARSFLLIGDSIAFGFGDGGIGALGGSGYLARALDVHGYPYCKMVVSGWTAGNLVSRIAAWNSFIGALSFTDMIQQLGVNDLANSSRSQAQLLADQQTIYGLCAGKKIFQTTITPETSSTDGWATTGNQTFLSGTGTLSQLNAVNASIRAVPAGVSVVLDVADMVMSARDTDIWAAPPSPTGDGIHPSTTKHASLAATIAGLI